MSQTHCYRRPIFYYETDRMAVVHHSNYIRYLEEARLQFMIDTGFSYAEMEAAGIYIPVVSVSYHYEHPAAYGDTILVYSTITKVTPSRFFVGYTIENETTGLRCGTAESCHCFTDTTFAPISLKKKAPEYYRWFTDRMELS